MLLKQVFLYHLPPVRSSLWASRVNYLIVFSLKGIHVSLKVSSIFSYTLRQHVTKTGLDFLYSLLTMQIILPLNVYDSVTKTTSTTFHGVHQSKRRRLPGESKPVFRHILQH